MSLTLTKKQRKALSGKGRSSAIVVVGSGGAASSPSKKKKGGRKLLKKQSYRVSDLELEMFREAIVRPFSERAIGARMPDSFAVPTVPSRFEARFTLTSDDEGNCGGVFLPCLHLTWLALNGTLTGSLTQIPANGSFLAAMLNYTGVSSRYTSFRVVAVGFEVLNIQPPTTATGRVVLATVPMNGPIPGPQCIGNVSAITPQSIMYNGAGWDPITGWSTVAPYVPSSIESLPTSAQYTMQELMTRPVQASIRPNNMDAFDFITAGNPYTDPPGPIPIGGGAHFGLGTTLSGSVGAAPLAYDHPSQINAARGWNALLLNATGLTPDVPCLECRIVFHLEGFPQIDSSSFFSAPASRPCVGRTTDEAVRIIHSTASNPIFALVEQYAGELASKGAGALLRTMFTKIGLSV
jgi:hypothetical protein